LIDATTGHVGESKRFGVRKNGSYDEDRTRGVELGTPQRDAADRRTQLRTNLDWKTEFVDLVGNVPVLFIVDNVKVKNATL